LGNRIDEAMFHLTNIKGVSMRPELMRAVYTTVRFCAAAVRRQRMLALLVTLAVCAAPCVTYAQFGGLMEKAKEKAIQVLTDKVMTEIEKKISDAVSKYPISDEAKKDITKKLTDTAKPVVKKFIDGASSGKLPNPMELTQTILKDILPQIPALVAAAKSGGGDTRPAAAPQQAPPQQTPPRQTLAQKISPVQQAPQQTVLAVLPEQPARNNPKIAVYAAGAKDVSVNKAVAMRLAIALANSGRYQMSGNYAEFFDRSAIELKDSATAVGSEQIKRMGENFGMEYVCVAVIANMFGEDRIFARIVNAGTAEITAEGMSNRPLKTLADLTSASEQLVETMFKKDPPPAAAPTPAPMPPPTVAAPCAPCAESASGTEPERKSKTGFAFGYGLSGDAAIFQLGVVHVRPITEEVISLVAEVNSWFGEGRNSGGGYYYDRSTGSYSARSEVISFHGANVPVLFRFEKSVVFSEAGVFLDVLSGETELTGREAWLTNVGIVLGSGLSFSKGYTHYFYRFNYGTAYYSHTLGIRQLF